MTTTVYNLATGSEETYQLEPLEALVSAAILDAGDAENVSNPITRATYHKRIIIGQRSAGLDNMAIDTKYL